MVLAISTLLDLAAEAALVIHAAVDNSAVYHGLMRFYSSNKVALDLLRRLHERLQQSRSTVTWLLIPGSINIADCPSRGLPLCSIRAAKTWDALQKGCVGERISTSPTTTLPPHGLRHQPPEDTETEAEAEEWIDDLLGEQDDATSDGLDEELLTDQDLHECDVAIAGVQSVPANKKRSRHHSNANP
jgi:hypothetical protein